MSIEEMVNEFILNEFIKFLVEVDSKTSNYVMETKTCLDVSVLDDGKIPLLIGFNKESKVHRVINTKYIYLVALYHRLKDTKIPLDVQLGTVKRVLLEDIFLAKHMVNENNIELFERRMCLTDSGLTPDMFVTKWSPEAIELIETVFWGVTIKDVPHNAKGGRLKAIVDELKQLVPSTKQIFKEDD